MMVRALHAASIEVILDVVYNHTGEGSHLGPTLAFRGIDNATYYRLQPHDRRLYEDFTGVRQHHRPAQSARAEAGDGQPALLGHRDARRRLPLRSGDARSAATGQHFDRSAAFFDAVHQDPILSQVKLIAEPWDLGADGYKVGDYPVGWSEWNGEVPRHRAALLGRPLGHDLASSRRGSPAAAISIRVTDAGPTRASTSSPVMTGSR